MLTACRVPIAFLACALACLGMSLGGCAPSEEEFASAVVTSALSAPEHQQLSDDVVDGPCALSAEAAASEAAERPAAGLYPASCVEKTARGSTLRVELADCTGPFGRVKLDGSVLAELAVTGECRLHADVHDAGLTANDRPLTLTASAEIEVLDGAHQVAWKAQASGTTRRGRSVEQTSALDVLVDRTTGCRVISGNTDGSVSGFEYDWSVKDMAICPGECPSSGVLDAAWHRGRRERNFHVAFDGSSVAHVTLPGGRVHDVAMVCEAAEAEADE